MSPEELKAFIRSQPPIIQSIIHTESGGNPIAVSPVGAKGLMQLMPAICQEFHVTDPFDPLLNVNAGKKLFYMELSKFPDIRKALASYNCGDPRIFKAMKLAESTEYRDLRKYLPIETQDYVRKCIAYLYEIAGEKDVSPKLVVG